MLFKKRASLYTDERPDLNPVFLIKRAAYFLSKKIEGSYKSSRVVEKITQNDVGLICFFWSEIFS